MYIEKRANCPSCGKTVKAEEEVKKSRAKKFMEQQFQASKKEAAKC
jgi:uncharacterized Zn finger protein (UPF0148 family)